MIRIGQIGNGSFGKKIQSKLKNISNVSVEWICFSQDKWWNQPRVDWVIIASPTEFHYEQSKHFLKQQTNVFCEKPATLSTTALKELIDLSIENNVCFYIDDVLIYENIKFASEFIYKKWSTSPINIIDRIAYHHFYLIFKEVKTLECDITPLINKMFHKKFILKFHDKQYTFEYDFEWYHKTIHNIIMATTEDALEKMLMNVLTKQVDFQSNHNRSLFATSICEYVKSKLYGKCAVVGAGIYGITAAIKLKTVGYDVDLYESKSDIMSAASGINQYRIHRGYHYPRSIETITSCKQNEVSFIKNYNRSIIDSPIDHFYCIASEDSLITSNQYLKILDKANLEWEIVEKMPGCDLTIKVNENLYDPVVLKNICIDRIHGMGVNLLLNTHVTKDMLGTLYEFKIYATYASLNEVSDKKQNYQFELCEKPVFKLPERYKNKSIVIMDGPFMCFDPYSNTDYHVAGNVVHAIHNRNIGEYPEIPSIYKTYLNKGIIKSPKYTNVNRFVESAKKFFPDIELAKHIGSMYTIRTVLPDKDSTDERPTFVKRHGSDFILFSGKIGNCVQSADKIVDYIINEVFE